MYAVSIILNVVFGKLCVQYHILIEVFLGHCISAAVGSTLTGFFLSHCIRQVVGSTPTAGHPHRFFPQSHQANAGMALST